MHRALADGRREDAMRYLAILRPIEDYRGGAADFFNISMLKAAVGLTGSALHARRSGRSPLRKRPKSTPSWSPSWP